VDARLCQDVLARYINDCRNVRGHNVRFVKLPEAQKALVVATRDITPVRHPPTLTTKEAASILANRRCICPCVLRCLAGRRAICRLRPMVLGNDTRYVPE
jgi:hypothetical protein